MTLMIGCSLMFIITFIKKRRAERISYIRSFKKGKGGLIYLFSIPLYWIGYLASGHNIVISFFYAIRKSVELVVLKFDVAPIQSLINENGLYCATIYLCFSLVCLNATLFIWSIIGQYVWFFLRRTQFKYTRKPRLILFGNNIQNESIYFSDYNRCKIIIDKIATDDALSLYMRNMLYEKCKDEHFLDKYIKTIINNSIRKINKTIVIINTGDDLQNIKICHRFINNIANLKEYEAITCFNQLKIFTFGDPKYETIYEEMMVNSLGCLSYINKYLKIAINLIEQHPFSKYLNETHVDYKTSLVKENININAFLVGFGKTNQQFFLSSVANNQFLTQSTLGVETKKVNYYLFDRNDVANTKKLNHNYNRYRNELLDINPNDYLPLIEQPANTLFQKLDINDIEFYNKIKSIASLSYNDINFVVIAFGSDLENVDIAKKLACKFREWGVNNFVIFVKVRNLCKEIRFGKEDNCHIVANENDIVYNIESILSDGILNMAQMRDEVYEVERALIHNNSISPNLLTQIKNQAYQDWYMRKTQLDRESCLYCCLSIRSKLNLMGLDYCLKTENDKRALTEQEYMTIYAANDAPNYTNDKFKTAEKPIISYSIDLKDSRRKNMAIQEHLRWNAFMISKGIIPASKKQILTEQDSCGKYTNGKNIKLRRHGCLTTFDGLIDFRKMIAKRDIIEGETMQQAELRMDVIKYDYQLLDDAYWILNKNGYKIVEK